MLMDFLVTFFVLSVLELLIYLGYNKYVSIYNSVYDWVQIIVIQVHPWKEILQDVEVVTGKV